MDEKNIRITIDGKEYKTLEEVPEQYRPMLEKQIQAASEAGAAALGQSGAKASDFKIKKEIKINIHRKEPAPQAASSPVTGEVPGIEPSSSGRQFAVLLLLAAGAFALYLLLKLKR